MPRCTSIALAVALCAAPAAGDSSSPDTIRACGTDYYFTVTPPPGWERAAEHPAGRIALTFTPPGKGASDAGLTAISLALGRASFRDDFDLDEVFEREVAGLAAQGSAATIRDGAIRHPILPSRATILEFPALSLYRVAMDVQSGRGYVMAATLSRVGGKPSADQIQLFERTLASLRYDAERVCARGSDNSTLEQAEPPPATREKRAADDGAESTPGQRALRRALSGGGMLEQLFVPLQFQPGILAGSPTLLMIFDRGGERSAEEMLETFRERVAVTYCWATQTHPLPRLAFVARETPRGKDPRPKVTPIRLYSCEKRDLGESHQIEEFDLDWSVAEQL